MLKITSHKARAWVFLAATLLLGAVGGVLWNTVVILPTFTVDEGLVARPTSESTLTAWFAAESWFSIIGIVISALLGLWAWLWFKHAGWVVTVVAMSASLVAAFLCWQVGLLMGPGPFDQRLASARVGDLVQIPLEVSGAAFLLWPFAAITPVMLAAVFSGRRETTSTMTP